MHKNTLFLSSLLLAVFYFRCHAMVDIKALERKQANEYVHKMFAAVNDSDIDALLANYNHFKDCPYTSVPGIPDFWSQSNLLLRAVQVSTEDFLDQFLDILPGDLTMTIYDTQGNEKTLADCAFFSTEREAKLRFSRSLSIGGKIHAAKKAEALNEGLRKYLNLIDGNTSSCTTNQAFYNNLKHQIARLLEKGATYPLEEAKSCVKEAARCGMGQLKATAMIKLGILPLNETVCVNDFLESHFIIALHNSIDGVAKAFISLGIDVNQPAGASSLLLKQKLKLLREELVSCVSLMSDGKFTEVPESVYEKLKILFFTYVCCEHENIITQHPREQRADLESVVEGFKADPVLKTLYFDITYKIVSAENLSKEFTTFCKNWKSCYAYRKTTPLMIAVKEKNFTMTRALLEAGARIETEDREGNGALGHNASNFIIESCLLDFYVAYLQKLTPIVREVLAASSLEQSADPLIHDIILPYIYPKDPYIRDYYENHLRSLKNR